MILDEIIEKFDNDRAGNGALHAREYSNWFAGIEVVSAPGETVTVSARKYRINRRINDAVDGRIDDKVADQELASAHDYVSRYVIAQRRGGDQAAQNALNELARRGLIRTQGGRVTARFRNTFTGKSNPVDIAAVLALLCASGRIDRFKPGFGRQEALQAYCDKFVGTDCSGFVNGFFATTGRFVEDNMNDPADGWTIANYARQGRRLGSAPGSLANHLVCWVKGACYTQYTGNSTIGFAHIAVVECWVRPPDPETGSPAGALFRCSQSSASMGGANTSVYEIVEGPTMSRSGRTSHHWRIKRVAGRSDCRVDSRIVWNDVFLAPPP